jgi:hypothetical protein
LCNDKQEEVTENLYDFLYQWGASRDKPAYLWIDALCIDQHDISERSHQVNIMGQIYTAASQVIIWLGPEDDSTRSAFELMKMISSLTSDEKAALSCHDVSMHNAQPLLDLERWKTLSKFFGRTWFSRAWIIQEAIFASTSIVLCGSHVTTWNVIAEVSHFLATSSWTNFLKDPRYFEDNTNQWHNTPARLAAQRTTWQGSYKDSLIYALIRARPSICQDPRDKVYSQLRLGHADIFPDYHHTISEVYTIAAEHILKQSGSMLLLTCVEGDEFQTPEHGLPSWVPDWSVTKFTGLRITGYRHFNAAGKGEEKRPPKYSISPDKRILDVEAVHMDDIEEVCDNKSRLRANLYGSKFWQLISNLSPTIETIHGVQTREEIVWRTLMTNRGRSSTDYRVHYPAPEEDGRFFRDWVLWRCAEPSEEHTIVPIPPADNNILPTQHEVEQARRTAANDPSYLAQLARQGSPYDLNYSHAMLHRPFRTKRGAFGIGTQSLRKGDSIWIVSGCRVPIIMRRVEGSEHYRLVGGSYTHGLMDGERLGDKNLDFDMVSLE